MVMQLTANQYRDLTPLTGFDSLTLRVKLFWLKRKTTNHRPHCVGVNTAKENICGG